MYTLLDCQELAGQFLTEEGHCDSHISLIPDADRTKVTATDQKVNKEKFKEWQSLKTRVQSTGFPPSKKQRRNLQQLFVASIPTSKPRVLEKPSAKEVGLVAFYERVSHTAIPRRPLHIPSKPKMGNKGAAKKGKAAAEAAKVAGEEHVAMPPTPEHTTNGDFETDDCEAEIAEPTTSTASQEKGKKKAPAAKTSGKAASSGGTKRTSDGLKKESSKKKPAQASENTTPPTTVRPASSNDAMYVTLQISPSLPMGPSAFTSPVFDIFVGPNKYQFSAHQAILAQSPVLEKLCTIQSTKKGRARTCLLMPRENPTNIAALLQYLYRGQLRLDIPVEPTSGGETSSAGTAEEELIVRTAKKLAKLHCVGVAYELSDLQSHVTKLLHESKLWEKLRGMEFFELAERLYPEDPDEADGDSFAKFFADHAPAKMKTVPENRISDLMRMIGSGGAFAEAIFMAFNTAARSGLAKASKLKVEEELQQGMKVQRDEVVQEENGNRHRDKRAKVEHEGVEGGDDGPAEGGPAGGGPAKDGPVEGGPVEGVSAEGGSAEDGPVEGGPVEGVSAEGGSAEDGPIEGGPAEGGPAEGGPES